MNLKYKDGNSVAKHLNNFQALLNELSTMKLELDDEVQSSFLMSSLPDNWDTLVVSLSNLAQNGMIIINMVKDNMFNEEARMENQGTLRESVENSEDNNLKEKVKNRKKTKTLQ